MTDAQLQYIITKLKYKHQYKSLPDKAIHKLSYLVYIKSLDRGATIEIPYFWYRYGVVTQQSASETSPQSPNLNSEDKKIISNVCDTVLSAYYNSSLKTITDQTYEDAPYEIFPEWRELDKQLSKVQKKYNPFFDNTPIREEIEDKINRVHEAFPNDSFPEYESDLAMWYFTMIRELDMGLENVDRLQKVNTTFWGIFTLGAAQQQHPNMTEQEVLGSLGLQSFKSERNRRRKKLSRLERESLNNRFEEGSGGLNQVTDSMIEPILESF